MQNMTKLGFEISHPRSDLGKLGKFNFFPFLITFYATIRQIHSLTNQYFIHFTVVTDFDGFADNHVKYCYNIDSLFITLQLTSLWGRKK